MNNSYDVNDFEQQNKFYNELAKFNWGAFLFNFVWVIPNGAIKEALPTLIIMFIFCFMAQIPLFGLIFVILNICLAIHLGKKGNEWAWYGKKWSSIDNFVKVQKAWGALSPLGLIIVPMIINFVVSTCVVSYSLPHAKKLAAKEKDTLNTAISRIVSSPKYETFKSGEDVANYMIENRLYDRYALREHDAVFVEKSGPYSVSLVFGKDEECSLIDKNCYVEYRIKMTKDPVIKNKVYYDDNAKVEFDERFQEE